MYYCLVNFPRVEKSKINKFRKKYDPLAGLIGFHITLIFPVKVPENVSEYELIRHISKVLKHQKSFEVRLGGLKKSWDHWLFLLLKNGNKKVIKLHDALYSGIMAKESRKDIEFIPHIGIGLFAKKGEKFDPSNPKPLKLDNILFSKALGEAKRMSFDYSYKFDKVSLVKFDNNFRRYATVKEFNLYKM